MTSNIFKSIKPKKTNNKKNAWKKIRRQKSIMSAGVMQSKKLPKGCNRTWKNVNFHLTSIYYNTQHS